MTNTDTTLRFTLGSSFGRTCYYPANEAAKAVVPGKRVALRADEVCDLLTAGRAVALDLNPYLGERFWVALTPATLPTA